MSDTTTHTCYIDSLDSLQEAKRFFNKNHEKYGEIVFSITGCDQLVAAPTLLAAVNRAKKKAKSDKLSIEGLPLLQELKERAEELERKLRVLEAIADTEHNDEDNHFIGDPDAHTTTYHHTTDMQRLLSSVQTMDINAFHELDKDVDGNIRRFEHHRAMFEDTKMEAKEKWIPSVENELYGDDEEDEDDDEEDEGDDEEEDEGDKEKDEDEEQDEDDEEDDEDEDDEEDEDELYGDEEEDEDE
nr:glutamic acid-rich protein-like [Aegilops tauschii subsp. strangulata]